MPDKTFTNPLTDEHIKEAERLKKAWFDHVFNSIARLAESVDKINTDLQDTKTAFYKEMFDLKDILRREDLQVRKDVNIDIEKSEKRFNKLIDDVISKLESSSIKDKDARNDIKKDIEKLRSEYLKEFDSIKSDSIVPLKEDVVKLRVTMAKWGGLGGIIATVIFSIIKWILPFILKIIQHVGL